MTFMPCTDSSSSIALRLDNNERFVSFEFAKITCGKEISARTDYNDYCHGKTLEEVLAIPYKEAFENLEIKKIPPFGRNIFFAARKRISSSLGKFFTFLDCKKDEEQFVLHLEWDALRCAIIQYLGVESEDIDKDRCRIASIKSHEGGVEIALIILPPKEMPNILPCSHSGFRP